jgi:hypothetical protein
MVITMTEEDFLKRWSRRKREADAAKPIAAEADASEAESAALKEVAPDKGAEASQAEFDPATLPPIESINALTDITAFLRAGVPAELTRAALRRVWTADPAIRDFVGLAENAWDFTDPNAMPGFGPLESSDEIRRMIAQVVDQIGEAARSQTAEAQESLHDSNALSGAEEGSEVAEPVAFTSAAPAESAAEGLENQSSLQSNNEDDAMQRDAAEDVRKTKQLSQRTHGTALPR